LSAYGHIVAALDFSRGAGAAFDAAAEMARREGARLTLVHVVAPMGPALPGGQARPADDKALAEEIGEYISRRYLSRLQGLDTRVALRRGHPSVEILAELAENPADLVVLGAQGLAGMGLVLLGSVAERVSRKCPCDCLVVKFDKAGKRG